MVIAGGIGCSAAIYRMYEPNNLSGNRRGFTHANAVQSIDGSKRNAAALLKTEYRTTIVAVHGNAEEARYREKRRAKSAQESRIACS
jgi:hypothetical protein